MLRILVLTTDLPYFPGKHGVDFFNLRYLARKHAVGVVGPLHPFFPEEGVANLERFLTGSYFWPRPSKAVTLPALKTYGGRIASWIERLSEARRERLLLHLLDLSQEPPDAYLQLGVLAHCADHLLSALVAQPWQGLVVIQSNTAPWFQYLPAHFAKLVYFHDVRTHFASRRATVIGEQADDQSARIQRQEREVCRRADVVAFVSDLDQERARALLQPTAETGVAPIPVDTDYYTPPPARWRKDGRSIVLFTGHLSHPPNVDAVLFFLENIWPLVRQQCPEAVFQVAGCLPAAGLTAACAAAGASVELHPDVPDIRPYFWNVAAYVVPMRFGGGVRQKIFEAWLMRAPVVSTTMAAEGTVARHGRNCWLEDEPAEFAKRVADLLHGNAPEEILQCASETVVAHNSIEVAADRFQRLVERSVWIKRSRPYKLLFDLRWMEIGKAGGLEQLAYEQLDAISQLDRQNAYRALCPRSTFTEWRFPKTFRCRGVFTDANELRTEGLRAGIANRLAESLQRQTILMPSMRALRYYKKLDFDLVHSVNSYIHPDLAGFPQILTMCDLQHLHYPEFFSAEDFASREQLYQDSCQMARHIICISEHTRQDLHAQYGVPLEKATTIWAIPSRAAWIELDANRGRDLLAGMGLESGRFLFYPAHSWGHKNHARLIAALALIAKDLPRDLRLVLTGRHFSPSHPAHALIAENQLEKRLVHVGYRSPLEVRALYSGAMALVFPSLFEGFGMPVAEAMIAGCPVACSNSSSLPEIVGDAAITFDPNNVEEIAAALLRIATDGELRSSLVAAGKRRRPLFSARLQAVKTLAVYRRVFDEFYGG